MTAPATPATLTSGAAAAAMLQDKDRAADFVDLTTIQAAAQSPIPAAKARTP